MFRFLPLAGPGEVIYDLIGLLIILILIEIVISNIIAFGGKLSPYHPFVKFVRGIVNPLVNPLRRVLPPPHRTMNLDFAPMLAMILLQFLRQILFNLFHGGMR